MHKLDEFYLRIRRIRNIQNPFDFVVQQMENAIRSWQSGIYSLKQLEDTLNKYELKAQKMKDKLR